MAIKDSPHFVRTPEDQQCHFCLRPTNRKAIVTEEFVCDDDVSTFALIQGLEDSEVFEKKPIANS